MSEEGSSPSFRAACYCGKASYKVEGSPIISIYCHCTICQRIHGKSPAYFLAHNIFSSPIQGVHLFTYYTTLHILSRGHTRTRTRFSQNLHMIPRGKIGGVSLVLGLLGQRIRLREDGRLGELIYAEMPKGWLRVGISSDPQNIFSTTRGCWMSTIAYRSGRASRTDQKG